MKCSNCGHTHAPGAQSCAQCAMPLAETGPTANPAPAPSPPSAPGNAPSRKPPTAALPLAVGVVALAGVIGWFSISPEVEERKFKPESIPDAANPETAANDDEPVQVEERAKKPVPDPAQAPAAPTPAATAKTASKEAQTTGSLPREVIVRIIRMNMGRLRACYEEGCAQS